MSLPNQIIMPADGAPNPFTIPGTARTYKCAAGASISVVGDDAMILRNVGWVSANSAAVIGAGATSGRPKNALVGQAYNDTSAGGLVIYAGPKTGWLHHATGASV
jgi:hypothetical protein